MRKPFLLAVTFYFFLFVPRTAYAGCPGVDVLCGPGVNIDPAWISIEVNGDQYRFSLNQPLVFDAEKTFCVKVTDNTGNLVGSADLYIDWFGNSTNTLPITITQPGRYEVGLYDQRGNLCGGPPKTFVHGSGATLTPSPGAGGGTDAQSCLEEGKTWVETLKGCYDLGGFINISLEWLMIGAALLALFRFTVGGIQYIFSQGQPDRLQVARQTITGAVFGLILVFVAWVLIRFLGENFPEWWRISFLNISP